MSFEVAPFGNNVLVGSGGNVTTQVHTRFGPITSGGNTGPVLTDGINQQLILDVTGETFNTIGEQLSLVATYLPKGAVIRRATVAVTTAFTLTGTTPTLKVGTFGSEGTNGISISQAQIQALGYYDVTSTQTGTWAAATPLAARTQVGGVITGGGALSTTGEMRITLVYDTIATSTV